MPPVLAKGEGHSIRDKRQRSVQLRRSTKDETKVHAKERTIQTKHNIVVVPVPQPQRVVRSEKRRSRGGQTVEADSAVTKGPEHTKAAVFELESLGQLSHGSATWYHLNKSSECAQRKNHEGHHFAALATNFHLSLTPTTVHLLQRAHHSIFLQDVVELAYEQFPTRFKTHQLCLGRCAKVSLHACTLEELAAQVQRRVERHSIAHAVSLQQSSNMLSIEERSAPWHVRVSWERHPSL
mmetsp:Transcript_44023/g.116429  ORF Transcript_44023/g.116429 Transcript_44023/m.116429 type:complete len:238 (-) Transcript_44023:228-941(-)